MAEKIQWVYIIVQNLIAFISLLYAIAYWKKIKENGYLKLFPMYTAISLSISLLWFFDMLHPGILLQNIFIVFEFFIFYYFFIKVLIGKKYYLILITLGILFFTSTIIITSFLYNTQSKYQNIFSFFKNIIFSELMVVGNIFIVIPVLMYYRSLFNPPYTKNLSRDPIFLAMTGIAFCFAISTPLFAFIKIIWYKENQIFVYVYMINSLAYIVMHLFFIKAYKSIK